MRGNLVIIVLHWWIKILFIFTFKDILITGSHLKQKSILPSEENESQFYAGWTQMTQTKYLERVIRHI